METKKSPKVNLEKGKALNLLMGLIVAMAIVFVGFEWGTKDVKPLAYSGIDGIEWIDEVPFTMPEPPTPPPPPATVVAEILTVVENTVEIEDITIETSEDNIHTPMDLVVLPPVTKEDTEENDFEIFIIVEEMPEFPGGQNELLKFLSKSVRYPTIAQETGLEGRVVCTFVINTDGSIVDSEVIRGIDPSLDKEALRVINSMPKWKPGKQRGKAVRVKFTVPITFQLQK